MKEITSGERRMIITAVAFTLLLLGFGWWWNQLNAMPQVSIPTPKMPSPNAFDIYAKAYQQQIPRPLSLYEGYNPKTKNVDSVSDEKHYKTWEQRLPFYAKPELKKWLASNQAALKTLRQGFPLEYREPPSRSFTATFPHYGKAREMARTLVDESNILAAQGDWKGAANSAVDAIELGNDIPRGGSLIAGLVGYAIQAIGQRQLQYLVPHLDAKTCRDTARRLEKLQQNRVTFDEVLTEEKWGFQASLLQIMQQGNWLKTLMQIVGSSQSPLKFRVYSKQGLMNDYTAYMDAAIAAAKQPYSTAKSPQVPKDPIIWLLVVAFDRSRWNAARAETKNATLIVALALRAYRLEHGAYPEKLNDLVPTYLQKVPADPFGSGEALRYKKEGADYKLWSIGADKKDDGGLPAIHPDYKRSQEAEAQKAHDSRFYFAQQDSQGDFVYGINH